jgi:hypothetical protein
MVLPGVTRAARTPNPSAIQGPPALFRQAVTFISPGELRGPQWRTLIGGAPIVRACIQTQIMLITGLQWSIEGDDDEAAAYFTKLLENAGADDGGWEVFLSRVMKDTLEVPFGGAVEFGHFHDGVVAWVHHIDGATMVPSYNDRYPYAQVDPFGGLTRPIPFRREQIGRVRWQAQSNLRTYGWTITPCEDSLPAIQGLLRADRFWQTFLMDSPPAGILDIPGFDEQEAKDWLDSWKTMLAGIDALKVPILFGANRETGRSEAKFIRFATSPGETQMKELIKAYAEEVCAAFGMSLGDLGLFGQELRLAGATKLIELSKRQGLAKLMRAVKSMIDIDVLPDELEFKWSEVDLEDDLRKAQAREIGSRRIKNLVDGMVITPQLGKRVAIYEEIIPAEALEGWEEPEETEEAEVDVTDQELGEEAAPTGEGVAEDQEERAKEAIQAFPASSKWAKQMARAADRMTGPARRGATKKRLGQLIGVGLKAWGKARSLGDQKVRNAPSMTPDQLEDYTNQEVQRSAQDARRAIVKALERVDWWKSPDLSDDVAKILVGAYGEGATLQIGAIEDVRTRLGLPAARIGATTFQLTNKRVLELIAERAANLVRHIDDGSKTHITRAIMKGVREGIASPEIARGLLADSAHRSVVETFKGRSMSIVNTEINWAESHAALDEQVKMGLSKKLWESIPGIRCELCERNTMRGPIPVKDSFESVFGSTDAPPGHPGVCHCYITFDRSELKGLGDDPSYWWGD